MPASSRKERISTIKYALITLMWVATRHFSQQLQSFGLTHPQFITLAALAAHQEPCTMRDLTDFTFQDPPTMTGIVDRLVKMELVQRSRSQADRRVVLVRATPAGMELVERIKSETMQDDLSGYAALSDQELAHLEQLLAYLIRMHVGRFKSLADSELDAEIERLSKFMSDPIYYMKLENEQEQPVQ